MLSIFNKNVVFQYKLMLAERRDLHLDKMRERFARKTSKILRRTSMSSINCNTSSGGSGGSGGSNMSIAKLATILILLNYGRKTRVVLEIFEYSEGKRVSRYDRCSKVPIPYSGSFFGIERFAGCARRDFQVQVSRDLSQMLIG